MRIEGPAIAAALGSACAWALGTVLLDRVCRTMSPWALTLLKGLLGLALMGAVLAFVGWTPLDGRTLGLLAVSGILGIGLGDTVFFMALRHLGAPTLVLLTVGGFALVPVASVAFLGEQVPPLRWAGIAATLGGVGVVLWDRREDTGVATDWRGVFWGVVFVLCSTASMVVAKRALAAAPSLQATFVRMAAGTAGVVLLGLLSGNAHRWVAPARRAHVWLNLVVAVLVVSFGGFWLSLYAVKHLDLSLASALMGTEPLFALLLAWALAKQAISGRALAGTLLGVAGVAILCVK